jgi:hypothetical protein
MQQLGATYPTFLLQDIPNISPSGRWFMGTGNFGDSVSHKYQFADDINYIKGKHSFKFGGEVPETIIMAPEQPTILASFFQTVQSLGIRLRTWCWATLSYTLPTIPLVLTPGRPLPLTSRTITKSAAMW